MPTGLEELQAALGGSYVLEREIGRGGMATVYLARDTKHGRSVALKVLHSEFAMTLGPDRFRREIALAARLQHPHILAVHDSGETPEGILWFTMPFVDGESLRDRLRRERQLSVEDTVRITRAVADALHYAHTQGVIHRDVKPENILLAGDQAMLADFGVARSLKAGPAAPGSTAQLTQTGFAVGTPAYMSPEQATGDREIDGRSDQYALAVVTYEMLAGEPPFSAPTPQAVIAKMLATPAPFVRVVRKDVPTGVDAAIHKALGTAPAARYASVSAFSAALESGLHTGTVEVSQRSVQRRWALAATAVVVVAVALAGYLRVRQTAGPTMLAVLPFETDGDTADAWITDGITDEVRGKLASLSGLGVIARSSSNQYRRSGKRPEDIGRELGVRYLLMGRIRWGRGSGTQREIRVEPELVQVADVRTPQTKWEEPFDEQQSDVFKLQSDIAARVAAALQIALKPAERQSLEQPPTHNPDAYYAYLRGVALDRSERPDDAVRARAEFRHAIALDSAFVDAWNLLSFNIALWSARHVTTAAFDDSARAAAERALALAPDNPDAISALAGYYELVKHDLPLAYKGYRTALDKAPGEAINYQDLAGIEIRLGHWDSARVHYERATRLNPRSAYAFNELGNFYLLTRRYDDAQRACAHAGEINPSSILTAFCLIQVPIAKGDLAGARAAIRAASPAIDSMAVLAFLASYGAYTWVFDSGQRRALLTLSPSAYDRGAVSWAETHMMVYDQLGDTATSRIYADSAIALLRTADGAAAADSDPDYGFALAYEGRKAEAIAAASRYLVAHPIDRDLLDGPDNAETPLKTYLRSGANDQALGLLQRLLSIPGRLTPGRIRIDPAFAPVRDDPRFKRLSTARAAGE
jgi:serine/threonine protein kinase/tetratricopeptide (TPR) repeat protein